MLTEKESKKRQKKQKSKRKEQRDKVFLMWTGVVFFMFLIFFLWLFNLKNIFAGLDRTGSNRPPYLDEFADEFYDSFDQLNDRLKDMDQIEEADIQEQNIFQEQQQEEEKKPETVEPEAVVDDNNSKETGEAASNTPEKID